MNQEHQRTIKKSIEIKGIGLHMGRSCRAIFHPAPENSGIKFIRVDLPHKPEFPAHISQVVDIIRGTTLGVGEDRIYTIEHILSALCGIGIDNVVIELTDLEPPVADGSSLPFVEAILKTGFEEQSAKRKYYVVDKIVEYTSHQTMIRIEPFNGFEVDCEIDYDHPLLKNQRMKFTLTAENYKKEIAPARTYCFDYEIEALKKKGLAKGGSLDNAIVVGPTGIYNPNSSLRFENEFIRHKILDLMGDLMLIGAPIQGRVVAKRCGHGHNIKFLRQLSEAIPSSSTLPVA